jgi:uncharacterized membrane protein
MSKKPMSVVAAVYPTVDGSEAAFKELKSLEYSIQLDDAAVIRMDEDGKVHIKETHDMGGGAGGGLGAVVGGALGLLVPGIGTLVGVAGGALIGGLAAKLHDAGFPNDGLKTLGYELKPGTSALLATVDQVSAPSVELLLKSLGGTSITETLAHDIIEAMEASGELAGDTEQGSGSTGYAGTGSSAAGGPDALDLGVGASAAGSAGGLGATPGAAQTFGDFTDTEGRDLAP